MRVFKSDEEVASEVLRLLGPDLGVGRGKSGTEATQNESMGRDGDDKEINFL